ncbi:MAG: bifunctional DNA-formamidopyrimidine glycosylase/DNA-(apurinic or apyrimidinic site) lyase, partial [FCB group bacterium]|nr:bifunctional DNA-formamidopyrimidine glycosylase/DNA-(apurinic or apyrimidinic site) lyase [FCB group bacterium]
MPELPEVETVARALRKTILGETVTQINIKPTASIFPDKRRFANLLRGSSFTHIRRRGKNILIDLSNDHTLWVHLKMTGHFCYLPKSESVGKHDHVVMQLADDSYLLRFNDYRRFGRLRIFPTNEIMAQPGLAKLGPEPLEIIADDFVRLMKNRKRMIKPALLDQTVIAGIGNIYADETLFLSRLHPKRLTDSVSARKLRELHGHIQTILKKAIRLMGTSVDSFAGVYGKPGGFQKYLLAYGRENQPCSNCE